MWWWWKARRRKEKEEGGGEGNERLPGGDLEDLGRHSDGSLDSEILILGSVDEIVGDYTKKKGTKRKRVSSKRKGKRKGRREGTYTSQGS